VVVVGIFAFLLVFLRGVLGKGVCNGWFFGGEHVVKCVVNVVRGMVVFG
jgi:hypothetical protein